MRTPPLTRTAGRMSLRAAGIATFAFLGLLALLISSAKATAALPTGWSSTIGTGTNVCAPGPGVDCSGVKHKWKFRHGGDLSQSDFSRAHLHGAKLHGANLQGANFSKAKLHRGKFHGADLTDAVFDGAKAKGAKFYGATLKNVSFRGANLKGANFVYPTVATSRVAPADWPADVCKEGGCSGLTLEGVDFTDADLAGADFSSAILDDVDFSGANLAGANFTDATLSAPIFDGASMSGATFKDAHLTDGYPSVRDTFANNVYFGGVEITDGFFTNASLLGASFRGARLTRVNFNGACAWNTMVPVGTSLTGAYRTQYAYSQRDPQADGSCPTS